MRQAHFEAANAVVDGTRVFNHCSANNAAGMVREKGAAGAVIEGAVPAVGGAAGQALGNGDPVVADATESLHDEGVDIQRPLFVHGVTVITRASRVLPGAAVAATMIRRCRFFSAASYLLEITVNHFFTVIFPM